jgi:hypothetical protein
VREPPFRTNGTHATSSVSVPSREPISTTPPSVRREHLRRHVDADAFSSPANASEPAAESWFPGMATTGIPCE